jgi:hypothetical protein
MASVLPSGAKTAGLRNAVADLDLARRSVHMHDLKHHCHQHAESGDASANSSDDSSPFRFRARQRKSCRGLTVDARPGNITPFAFLIIHAGALNISLGTSFRHRTNDEMIALDPRLLASLRAVRVGGPHRQLRTQDFPYM